jgi:hypothetical protein
MFSERTSTILGVATGLAAALIPLIAAWIVSS